MHLKEICLRVSVCCFKVSVFDMWFTISLASSFVSRLVDSDFVDLYRIACVRDWCTRCKPHHSSNYEIYYKKYY